MPTPREYTARDGSKTWKVRFRRPDGRNSSMSFTDRTRAKVFATDITTRGIDAALDLQRELEEHDGVTVDEIAEQFLTWKSSRVKSDRTIADYRRDYRRWIQPWFGNRPATAVTQDEVQAWVDAMHTGKLYPAADGRLRPSAAKSVADRHGLLHSIYAFGASPARALVPENPTVGTDLPRRRRGNPKGLRPAEWQALHAALKQIDPDAADLAAFLIGSGWRWSEATALTTFDVEDDGEVMHVTMSQVVRRNAAGQHVIVQDSKSEAGMRRIALDPATASVVRRRVDYAIPGGLVFTNARGHQWHHSNFRDRAWKPAVAAAGLRRQPTVHWLRHTHVGMMLMAGARLHELQGRVGHASIATTVNVYGRMVTDVDTVALGAFAALRDSGGAVPALPQGGSVALDSGL